MALRWMEAEPDQETAGLLSHRKPSLGAPSRRGFSLGVPSRRGVSLGVLSHRGVQPQAAQQTPGKSVRISSPEQVDDYIRVTTPGMWLLVAAMLILLCALILWGLTTKLRVKDDGSNGQAKTEYVTPASFLTDASTGN